MKNRFNLVEEPWVPISNFGRVSLWQIFTNPNYLALGGNPVQKIAVTKLLLAIAQAAFTPKDDIEWQQAGSNVLAEQCCRYLEKWSGRFFLYGDDPFLQLPTISAASEQNFGAVLPEISTGNTTVLTQSQVERKLDDADRALLLTSLMGFALAGKKTDNSVTLTPGYEGKKNANGRPSSGKAGPAVSHMGLLHNFLLGASLQETLWLNLLTEKQIRKIPMYPNGIGTAPWEEMPIGEDCETAKKLKLSLMGRLVPLCRFCLLTENGLHYSEGIAHQNYKDGLADPSVAIDYSKAKPKALWVNPEKRPWRELTSLLSFLEQTGGNGYQRWDVQCCLDRTRDVSRSFAIWSGGLRVSSNAGEQYTSGSDDFVDSTVWLKSSMLGESWFIQLRKEMDDLERLAKSLYGCVMRFFAEQKNNGKKAAATATHFFWQLCERQFQTLVFNSDQDDEAHGNRIELRRRFASYIWRAYDQVCPKESARQLDAWAHFRPNCGKYLNQKD